MHERHEPDNEFVERLEWHIGREARKRNQVPGDPGRSRLRIALMLVGLTLLSMGIGAVAAAAAYQAQNNQRREILIVGLEQREQIAKARIEAATVKLKEAERLVTLGLLDPAGAIEARVAVAEAEAQLKSVELQLQETRITGREPLDEVSSPLVSGRDFVSERLRTDLSVAEKELEVAKARVEAAQRRLSLGLVEPAAVEVARAGLRQVEASLKGFQRRLEIRQQFVGNKINPSETELLAMEGEAQQRARVIVPQVEIARLELERTQNLVQKGLAPTRTLAEATLKLRSLEAELAKVQLDLAVISDRLRELQQAR
jgi:multidrug resistance efflux pump